MTTLGVTGCAPGVTVCPLDGTRYPLERDVDPFKRILILLESKGYSGVTVCPLDETVCPSKGMLIPSKGC